MKTVKATLCMITLLALSTALLYGEIQQKENKTFSGKDKVKINTVSGDVIIKAGKSNKIIVDLVYEVTPKDAFKPIFLEQGSTLRLKEEWRGRSSSGRVTWTITVPADTKIEFNTASGDFTASGLKNDVDVSTASGAIDLSDMECDIEVSVASGDINLRQITGDIEISAASGEIDADEINGNIDLSTASGDIDLRDSKGIFDVSCASGDLDAEGIILDAAGSFSTASGDVTVSLAKTAGYDLDLSAASGNAVLEYNGNSIQGTFEFVARKSKGRIISPFTFDTEDEYKRHDRDYVRKTFTKGSSSPMIKIHTASGTAALKK